MEQKYKTKTTKKTAAEWLEMLSELEMSEEYGQSTCS